MQKLDPDKLPDAVKAAHAAALRWVDKKFEGRRIKPAPVVVAFPTPELGEGATLHAILVPPNGTQRERLRPSAMDVRAALTRGTGADVSRTVAANASLVLVECCLWVEGMPEDTSKDPRVLARDYLMTDLKEEAGSLGQAFDLISNACMELLNDGPEVRLGKL